MKQEPGEAKSEIKLVRGFEKREVKWWKIERTRGRLDGSPSD